MSDTNQTPTTPAATPPAPEAKPAKPQLAKQNGVTRPGGGQTGRVWAIADEISAAQKRPALRKEVIEKGRAEGINPATLATQYGRWRKFFGLGKEAKPAAATATPAPAPGTTPAAPASDVSVEQK